MMALETKQTLMFLGEEEIETSEANLLWCLGWWMSMIFVTLVIRKLGKSGIRKETQRARSRHCRTFERISSEAQPEYEGESEWIEHSGISRSNVVKTITNARCAEHQPEAKTQR